jgi:hypothetical protein
MSKIHYRKRLYKYQLAEDYSINIGLQDMTFIAPFFILKSDGTLLILEGYAWDGPSGPTFKTKNFMRGSLVHDAMYQAIRMGLLSVEYKDLADRILQLVCIEDGMSKIRAWWVYEGVHKFGAGSCVPMTDQAEMETAP